MSRGAVRIAVTSPKDSGPGSLREALFAADKAKTPTRIEILSSEIVLESALPPLVNPNGVTIEGMRDDVRIDARASGGVPVFDIGTPGTIVRRLTIQGSAAEAILVRAPRVQVSQVTFDEDADGIRIVQGGDNLLIEDSVFEANGAGVRLTTGVTGVTIRRNQFVDHGEAAVFAAAASPSATAGHGPAVVLRNNKFKGDRISVVLVNVLGQVEDNNFNGAHQTAVYLTGPALVRRNRIQHGSGMGLYAEDADGAVIEDNEVNHNGAGGIQVRGGRLAEVRRNRVYGNGYGIIVVFGGANSIADNLIVNQSVDGIFVLGGAPVLRANRLMSNTLAGLRLLDYVPLKGEVVNAAPVLVDNVVQANGFNEPLRGRYHEPPPDSEVH
jgi:hypothetical protein